MKRPTTPLLFVAWLRAINVGGNNRLPMKNLVSFFEEAGCSDVRHYIQSGNVVFRSSLDAVSRVREHVRDRIEAEFGHRPEIVFRTHDELRAVLTEPPFAKDKSLFFGFLDAAPDPAGLAKLDPERGAPDRYAVSGRDVYMQIGSAAKTKITHTYFQSKLGRVCTVRNLATTEKMLALCDELATGAASDVSS